MVKKLAVVMAIVSIGLAAFVVKMKMNEDNVGPEITFTDAELVYMNTMTDEELLADVVAMDDKEGDVSSSLTVENVHVVSDEEVIVIYVAKDSNNNITKLKRVLSATAVQEEEPKEETDIPEESGDVEVSEEEILEEAEEAQSGTVLNFDELAGVSSEEEAETQVTEAPEAVSADGKSEVDLAREEQEALADNMPAGSPRLYLTDYWIEVPVGTTIDAISYVKNIEDDVENFYDLSKKIQIYDANGNQPGVSINFPAAGTYTYTYYVVDNQSHTSNSAKLTVVAK